MSGCKNGCDRCSCGSSAKGERGLTGPQGPQGEPGPAGPTGAGIVNKFNFFDEHTDDQPIDQVNFYHPAGYDILSWTNNTGAQIILIAQGVAQSAYDLGLEESDDVGTDVEMAIVKTVAAVDSFSYYHAMKWDLRGGNFDALYVAPIAGIPLRIASPPAPRKISTDEDNPTEFRFGQAVLNLCGTVMKKVTLQDGETVSLKFRSKGSGSILRSAQLFLQQLDQ